MMTKYNLPPLINTASLFPESGDQLTLLSMDEFVRRIPQVGPISQPHTVQPYAICQGRGDFISLA